MIFVSVCILELPEVMDGKASMVPVDASTAAITDISAYVDPRMSAVVVWLQGEAPFTAPDIFAELGPFTSLSRPDIRLGDDGYLLWARVLILASASRLTSSLGRVQRRASFCRNC